MESKHDYDAIQLRDDIAARAAVFVPRSMSCSPPHVLRLSDAQCLDAKCAGNKAARLGRLLREGLPVPEGLVLTVAAATQFYRDNALSCESPASAFDEADLPPAVRAALESVAIGRHAVRSSAVCEDSLSTSYAGLFRTVLDVEGAEDLAQAVRRCWAAIGSSALRAYRNAHNDHDSQQSLAILVQKQVTARVAGVACSRDPLNRADAIVISAVRGSSAHLLEGSCSAEDWIVTSDALCQSSLGVLSTAEARAVATLVRKVARFFPDPHEIEWAFEADRLHLLQARPLTGAPPTVLWQTPRPGAWLRNIRLGEWLGAPVTPLAATWLLPALEQGVSRFRRRWTGLAVPEPSGALVHGWYYGSVDYVPNALIPAMRALSHMLAHVVRHPRRGSIIFMGRLGDPATRLCLREWTDIHLPRQRQSIQEGKQRLAHLSPRQLRDLIDELVDSAAAGFGLVSAICGVAWKAELLLAEYCRRNVGAELKETPQRLLCGLAAPGTLEHAVFSLDWSERTSGELGLAAASIEADARTAHSRAEALQARDRILASLAARPAVRRRLTELANRACELASERSRAIQSVTEGWPLMRQALLRLGAIGVSQGRLERAEDVFFLEKTQLDILIERRFFDLRAAAAAHRQVHRLQRQLTPPIQLGDLPPGFRRALDIAETLRTPSASSTPGERLIGLPASPGRASGPVRIARTPDAVLRLRDGEIAVLPLLVPAWVPLMARAAAIVVDTGNHLAHACVLARELGLPCVVGMGNATARLVPGEWVAVDGAGGVVERAAA